MVIDPRTAELERYVRENLVIDEGAPLSSTTPLVSDGLVDSMGIVMLAAFIEDRFGVRISEDEIMGGSDSIDAIVALIDRCR